MTKIWEYRVGKFEFEMAVDDRELTAKDVAFAEGVVAMADGLFQKAKEFLLPVLSPARKEFSVPPTPGAIDIIPHSNPTSTSTPVYYQVRVEVFFPKEEQELAWSVLFNVQDPFPGNRAKCLYWPVELGRRVR